MRFFPLFSGSSGNCSLIEGGGVRVLIDAGLSGKAIEAALTEYALSPDTIDAILITHEHIDHIRGVGVLSRRYDIPVYANTGTWQGMCGIIGNISPKNERVFETGRSFFIKQLDISPFSTPHDANESVCYVCMAEGRKLSIMTDIGHVTNALLSAVEYSNLLLLESNYDIEMLDVGSYPYPLKRRIKGNHGHLSNEDAGAALVKLYNRGIKRTILGHLSKENNTEIIARLTVENALAENEIYDMSLCVAHRDRSCGQFYV
ncbi:MAG: MBL fold metallo-hydrolase [Clostridia bacterium]